MVAFLVCPLVAAMALVWRGGPRGARVFAPITHPCCIGVYALRQIIVHSSLGLRRPVARDLSSWYIASRVR
eukprot:9639219-Lingulodinium_polyedra.AAC.1